MATSARKSQDFVPIKEIRDGIIILKDGGLRAVLIVSSINLSLKSSDEQIATINEFQTFLNGLDFPIQISIQPHRLDIRPYLLLLEERMKEQVEQLMKIQTKEYSDFIKSFTDEVNIMTKTFFIVVPYGSSPINMKGGILENLVGGAKPKKSSSSPAGQASSGQAKKEAELADFEEKRTQLDQRVNVVISGLSGMGIRSSQLNTEEVVELFYKTFNPGDISQGIKL